MKLTEFLLARIAEDEERAEFVARQLEGSNWQSHEPWMLSWHDEYDLLCIEPSRALAECEAKRLRLKIADDLEGEAGDDTYRWAHSVAEQIRKVEALPYAEHPDYRPEWKP